MDTRRWRIRKACDADAPCVACLHRRLLEGDPAAVKHVGQAFADELRQAARAALETAGRPCCTQADLINQFLLALLEEPRSLLASFEPEQGSFAAYLRQVAEWRMRDYATSRAVNWPKRTLQRTIEELDPESSPHLVDAHTRNGSEELAELLAPLDEQSRWLIEARYGIGPFDRPLKVSEIGKRLGISAGQVSRRVKALLQRLRSSAE